MKKKKDWNLHPDTGLTEQSLASKKIRKVIFFILPALLLMVFYLCFSGCDSSETLESNLAQYMSRAEKVWNFTGAVLVARGDTVLFREGFGAADIAEKRKVSPEMKFLIGSVTKSFTAIAILQLAEQGKLNLGDSLAAYLPGYRREVAERVTLHHLLSHQSGLPDLVKNPGFRERVTEPLSTDELISFFEYLPLEFEPGERYTYSSSNYILLGKIIETVSGEKWADYVRKNICEPLEMLNTGVFLDYGSRDDFAVGYNITPGRDTVRAQVIHPSCGFAAGALASTVDDLYLLHKALYKSSVLSRLYVDSMLTPYTPFYGYGWLVDDLAGHRLTGHGGGTPGFTSMFQRWLEDSVCIVVLSNNALVPAHTIATGLAAITLGEVYELPRVKTPLPRSPESLEQFTGVYGIDSADYRLIEIRDGRLIARRMNNLPMVMLAEEDDKFYFAHDQMATLTFVRNDSGRIIAHVFKQTFTEDTAWLLQGEEAERIMYGGTITEADRSVLEKLVGNFKIEPADFTLSIKLENGELYARAFNSPPFKMLAVSDSVFALEGLSARISINGDSEGPVDTLRFSQDGQSMLGIREK